MIAVSTAARAWQVATPKTETGMFFHCPTFHLSLHFRLQFFQTENFIFRRACLTLQLV